MPSSLPKSSPAGARAPCRPACAALLIALGLGAACQGPLPSRDVTPAPEVVESTKRYKKEYVIASGDTIEVLVRNNAAVSRPVVVRPDGFVTLPLLDDVKAAGLTFKEMDDQLTELFSHRLKDPEVSVIAVSVRQPMVYVFGEVGTQAAVELRNASTAAQAIARCGGLKDTADKDRIIVVRLNEHDRLAAMRVWVCGQGQPQALMALGGVPLQADDMVFVPKTGIAEIDAWIGQWVNQPLSGLNQLVGTYVNYKLIEAL